MTSQILRLYNSVGLESSNFAAFGVSGRTPEIILRKAEFSKIMNKASFLQLLNSGRTLYGEILRNGTGLKRPAFGTNSKTNFQDHMKTN